MAADMEPINNYEVKDLQHSLRAADLEIKLERSKHSVQIVTKDEEVRKLRVKHCLLQDEISDVHDQLEEEQARSDDLETALDEALVQLDEQRTTSEAAQLANRMLLRENANLKAELKTMENVSSDSDKAISDKLALSRELSTLRPEVEHLRAQVESNQGLLAEKLSLQRQVNTMQVELENERRSAARSHAKQGKNMERSNDLQGELEDLRKQLAKEKKDRTTIEAALIQAERAADEALANYASQQQVTERTQAKLDKANKKDTSNVRKANDEPAKELLQIREELKRERAERQKLERTAKSSKEHIDTQNDDLQKELLDERRDRKRQEKEFSKTFAEMQGRNAVLDDKLNAFREKLRTTKEKLKEKEMLLVRLGSDQTGPIANLARATSEQPHKVARKRLAASVETETNLGTPGDGFPAKKAKRTAISSVGEVSNFSLTPFLNRTASVAPGQTILEEDEEDTSAAPQEATPTAPPKTGPLRPASKSKPLAPSASNRANAKPRKAASTALDVVAEEATQEPQAKSGPKNAPITVPLKAADDGTTQVKSLKVKPRKSLMSFATFTEEPAAEKKKKRKLGASTSNGGLGKTLFDAEDDEEAPTRPLAPKGLFAARALGKNMLGKGRAGGQQGPVSGGYNMMSAEGFSFSPLKKERRGASILK